MFNGFGPIGFAPLADDGVEDAAAAVTGTATQTLPALTQSGTGVMHPSGTAAQTLPALTQSATGVEEFTGTGAQTLPAVTQSATGLTGATFGTGTQTLPAVTQAATGVETMAGTAAQTLPAVEQSGTGVMQPSGTAVQTLPAVEQAGSGTHSQTAEGAAAQTLPAVTQSATGTGGEEVATPRLAGGPGGKYRHRGRVRYPRRVMVNGRLYWVNSAAEERRLIAQYEAALVSIDESIEAVAGPDSKPLRKLRVKQKQAQRRIDESYDREAEWEALLDEEDEIILMTLH